MHCITKSLFVGAAVACIGSLSGKAETVVSPEVRQKTEDLGFEHLGKVRKEINRQLLERNLPELRYTDEDMRKDAGTLCDAMCGKHGVGDERRSLIELADLARKSGDVVLMCRLWSNESVGSFLEYCMFHTELCLSDSLAGEWMKEQSGERLRRQCDELTSVIDRLRDKDGIEAVKNSLPLILCRLMWDRCTDEDGYVRPAYEELFGGYHYDCQDMLRWISDKLIFEFRNHFRLDDMTETLMKGCYTKLMRDAIIRVGGTSNRIDAAFAYRQVVLGEVLKRIKVDQALIRSVRMKGVADAMHRYETAAKILKTFCTTEKNYRSVCKKGCISEKDCYAFWENVSPNDALCDEIDEDPKDKKSCCEIALGYLGKAEKALAKDKEAEKRFRDADYWEPAPVSEEEDRKILAEIE